MEGGGKGEAARRCQCQVRDLPDDERERAAREPLLHGPGDVGGSPCLDDEEPRWGQAQACEPRPIHVAKLAGDRRGAAPQDARARPRVLRPGSGSADGESDGEGEGGRGVAMGDGLDLVKAGEIEAGTGEQAVDLGGTKAPGNSGWGGIELSSGRRQPGDLSRGKGTGRGALAGRGGGSRGRRRLIPATLDRPDTCSQIVEEGCPRRSSTCAGKDRGETGLARLRERTATRRNGRRHRRHRRHRRRNWQLHSGPGRGRTRRLTGDPGRPGQEGRSRPGRRTRLYATLQDPRAGKRTGESLFGNPAQGTLSRQDLCFSR